MPNLKLILKIILLILIIISIAGFLYYPAVQQTQVIINKPLFDVYKQLRNAESWTKWDTQIGGKFVIKKTNSGNGFSIATKKKRIKVSFLDALTTRIEDGDVDYTIVILPLPHDNATEIVISFKTNSLFKLIPDQSKQWLKKTIIGDLKNHLEDTFLYYGVNLRKQTLAAANMMVCQSIVKRIDQFDEMKRSIKKIHKVIPIGEYQNSDKIFLQKTSLGETLNLFVGVIVKKQLPSIQGIIYMHLPVQKALIVNYQGRYNAINKIYSGIEAYIHDHHLKSATPPIEVYNASGLPTSDSSLVNMQIIFSAY